MLPYYTARNILIENGIKDYSLMLNYLQASAEKASAFCNAALQITRSGCIQMQCISPFNNCCCFSLTPACVHMLDMALLQYMSSVIPQRQLCLWTHRYYLRCAYMTVELEDTVISTQLSPTHLSLCQSGACCPFLH